MEILECSVREPTRVGDSLTGHMEYAVTTETSLPEYAAPSVTVRRRFRDFFWLREALVENHPGVVVPVGPEKNLIASKTAKEDSVFIERRRHALERFLRRVAAHPKLRNSTHLRYFLEYPEKIRESTTKPTQQLSTAFFSIIKDVRKSVASVVASASVTVNEQEDAWFKANEVRLDHLHCDLKLLHKVMRTAVTDLEQLSGAYARTAKALGGLGGETLGHHVPVSSALTSLSSILATSSMRAHEQMRDLAVFQDTVQDYVVMVHVTKDKFSDRADLFNAWSSTKSKYLRRKETAQRLRADPSASEDKKTVAICDFLETKDKLKALKEQFREFTNNLRDDVDRFYAEHTAEFMAAIENYIARTCVRQRELLVLWRDYGPVVDTLVAALPAA